MTGGLWCDVDVGTSGAARAGTEWVPGAADDFPG